jgi:hypothetical protein
LTSSAQKAPALAKTESPVVRRLGTPSSAAEASDDVFNPSAIAADDINKVPMIINTRFII